MWYAVLCLVTQSHLTLLRPHGMQPARLLCPWGFSRQKYWSGLPVPSGDLSNPEIKPRSPALQADSLLTATREAQLRCCVTSQFLWLFHWQLCVSNHYFFFESKTTSHVFIKNKNKKQLSHFVVLYSVIKCLLSGLLDWSLSSSDTAFFFFWCTNLIILSY